MLDTFRDLLCSKLCWHDRPGHSKICVHILFYVHAHKDLTLSQILLTYVYKIFKFGKFLIKYSFIMQENPT